MGNQVGKECTRIKSACCTFWTSYWSPLTLSLFCISSLLRMLLLYLEDSVLLSHSLSYVLFTSINQVHLRCQLGTRNLKVVGMEIADAEQSHLHSLLTLIHHRYLWRAHSNMNCFLSCQDDIFFVAWTICPYDFLNNI